MLPFMTQPAVAPACYVPGYVITRSLVFNGAQRLTRAITATGNRQTFAYRALVARTAPGTAQCLYNVDYYPHAPCTKFTILADDTLYIIHCAGGVQYTLKTAAVFRSPGFYDVLIGVDCSHPTPSERLVLYVNGVRVTSFSAVSYPPQGYAQGLANVAGGTDLLGAYGNNGSYAEQAKGSFADVVWLDGHIPNPTDFGSFNIHGVWVPKRPAFTLAQYGVNGWFLDFSDSLNPGKDVSGKGNHFIAIGFDAGGKATVASSPTNVYATMNPLLPAYGSISARATLTDGNLKQTGQYRAASSMPIVIPAYAECTVSATTANGYPFVGVWSNWQVDCTWPGEAANSGGSWSIFNASLRLDGGTVANVFPPTQAGDVVGVAVDPSGGNVWMRLNGGAWVGGGSPEDHTVPTFSLGGGKALWFGGATDNNTSLTWNFGQRAWAAAAPTGFGALCTAHMPEPAVKDPAEAYTDATATGANMVAVLDAGTAHWTGQWVEIIKRRDGVEDWRVRFSDDPGNAMATNASTGKAAAPALVPSGNYWGCRLRTGGKFGVASAEIAHVAGTPTTVTHGLGKPRNSVILKFAGPAGGDWRWWHPDMAPGQLATLNGGGAAVADGTITAVGANSFQIAATAPSGTYRWLVIAEGAGHICLTTHIGSGAADEAGAFVPSTVCPELFIARRVSLSGDTMVLPVTMNPVNPATQLLVTNLPMGETSYRPADLVVGGVKLRGGSPDAYHNTAGAKYVSIQIGRPIGGVCVAPATAR